jgi:hypothetical protein
VCPETSRQSPRLSVVLAPWAWAGGLALAAWTPGVSDVLACLRVLRGPAVAVPFLLAAWVSLERAGRLRWPPALDRTRPRFALAMLVLVAAGQWYTSRLRVTGDEPHYLLMAQSLWREHDLDLRDNFERQDYLEYTPGPVAPHYGNPRLDGRPFPAHSPALPILLAPLYAIGGRRLCVVALAVCGAWLAHVASRLAERAGADATGRRLAWVACVGPPAFFYSFHVYTELPSALAIALALDRLWEPGARPARALAGAVCVAVLPWLHLKLMLAAGVLAVVGLWRTSGRARLVLLGALAAAGVLFLGWYHYVFGRPTPFAIYGGLPPEFSEGRPLEAAIGLWLDRSFGILPVAPVFLLALAGLRHLVRTSEGRVHLLLLGALLGPVITWRMWWGGQCPPARFLVPGLAPLAVAAALATTHAGGRGLARWAGVLAASGFTLAAVAIAHPGALLLVNRGDRPTRLWAALSGPWPIERYLPSLVFGGRDDVRVAVLWIAAVAVVLVADLWARRDDRVDRAFGSAALPIALALAIGLAVDAWARPLETREAPTGTTEVPTGASAANGTGELRLRDPRAARSSANYSSAGASGSGWARCRWLRPASGPAPGPPRSTTPA